MVKLPNLKSPMIIATNAKSSLHAMQGGPASDNFDLGDGDLVLLKDTENSPVYSNQIAVTRK